MKKLDMHIHLGLTNEVGDDILDRMDSCGLSGGCIFSPPPDAFGGDLRQRLDAVLDFVKGREDRLFPVLWIHPYEPDILAGIDLAVAQGIVGFKIICSDFLVSEPQCIHILRHIAAKNKPVFFHSGILWDGKISSENNRPLHFEALLDVPGLRFSMGHCSWPWHDECLALYGKYLNALQCRPDAAEMFLDITPGTPEIYREDLLRKLFYIGYDTHNNILFGTDCSGENYSVQWAEKWLALDGQIMDKLNISQPLRQKLYWDNVLRFLGKTSTPISHKIPTPDQASI